MSSRYRLLNDLPRELWFRIKGLLHPSDVMTGSKIWGCIFKTESWLKLALTFDRCCPVLLGYDLSRLRPRGKPKKLYVALLARDYSGDLQWKKTEFFEALQDGWKYDETRYEVQFPSGLTVNVYEVLTGADEARLPLPKIFMNKKNGVHSEYLFYTDNSIRQLGPSGILTHGSGPAHQGRAMRNGCKLQLLDGEKSREYFIAPRSEKKKVKW